MRVVVDAAVWVVPWFCVASITEMPAPAPALVGADTDTMRSARGVPVTVIDLVHVLLASFNSSKALPPSATTIRLRFPGGVSDGIVTVVGPESLLPAIRDLTGRSPICLSAPSKVASLDK